MTSKFRDLIARHYFLHNHGPQLLCTDNTYSFTTPDDARSYHFQSHFSPPPAHEKWILDSWSPAAAHHPSANLYYEMAWILRTSPYSFDSPDESDGGELKAFRSPEGYLEFREDQPTKRVYVADLWVNPGHRRKGVATGLLRRLGAYWFWKYGGEGVIGLTVEAENAKALKLYRGLGFGEIVEFWVIFNEGSR